MTDEPKITGVYKFLDALSDVIIASDPAKRETLAKTIDAWAEDFPDEFHWAMGIQAPVLLHHLLMEVDMSCRPDAASKPRPIIRLVDRKPQTRERVRSGNHAPQSKSASDRSTHHRRRDHKIFKWLLRGGFWDAAEHPKEVVAKITFGF